MTTSVMAAALNAQVVTTSSLLALDLSPAHFKGLSLHVAFMLIPMLYNAKRDVLGDILAKLAAIIDAGKLKPLLDAQAFGFAEVGAADAHLSSGRAVGKVVVEI